MTSREIFEKTFPVPSSMYFDEKLNKYLYFASCGINEIPYIYNVKWDAWQASRAWKKLEDEFPKRGEYVLLKINGVVQYAVFYLSDGDDGMYWQPFDDECDGIKYEMHHEWQYLPE